MGTNLPFFRFATTQFHMNIFPCGADFFGIWSLEFGISVRLGRTAEGVGFEPTKACALPVFKTGAINHSTTPPKVWRARSVPSISVGASPLLDYWTAQFCGGALMEKRCAIK